MNVSKPAAWVSATAAPGCWNSPDRRGMLHVMSDDDPAVMKCPLCGGTGVASGSYNIAQCEISQDPLTGQWADTNSSG